MLGCQLNRLEKLFRWTLFAALAFFFGPIVLLVGPHQLWPLVYVENAILACLFVAAFCYVGLLVVWWLQKKEAERADKHAASVEADE